MLRGHRSKGDIHASAPLHHGYGNKKTHAPTIVTAIPGITQLERCGSQQIRLEYITPLWVESF